MGNYLLLDTESKKVIKKNNYAHKLGTEKA